MKCLQLSEMRWGHSDALILAINAAKQQKKSLQSNQTTGDTDYGIPSTTHCERAAWRLSNTYIFSLIQSLLYGA